MSIPLLLSTLRKLNGGPILAMWAAVLVGCGSNHAPSSQPQPPPPGPPTVQVSVVASDPGSNQLSYRWKSTDGTIMNVNAPTTTWVLPNGPGLHFAYVLVSNGIGGYTERRIAVNTDVIGTPTKVPAPQMVEAAPALTQSGDLFRSSVQVPNAQLKLSDAVYLVDVPVFVTDHTTNIRYPSSSNVFTDFRGEFVVPGLPSGTNYGVNCSFDGGVSFMDCTPPLVVPSAPPPLRFTMPTPTEETSYYWGYINGASNATNVLMTADPAGSPCGTLDEFFGVHSTGSALLLNGTGGVLGTTRGSELGLYSFPYNANASSAQVNCEGLSISLPFTPDPSGNLLTATPGGVVVPVVTTMTATLNGNSVGTFLPPPSGLPSDTVVSTAVFLGEKGIDTQLGACMYYKAVGAVRSCDAVGNPSGAISFDDWKRTVKIGPYATPGTTEYTATYVNRVDLNLTRDHHSISYGSNQTAAYVCNYLGPPFALVNAQADIDTAVGNATNGKNLVACVAMDWAVTAGVNGDAPFTRFLIFGPSGQLLLSINLDGRGEKYVPGSCVACHGGDHYAGKFPEDGSGKANVGGHFLPYDIGNFLFSSVTGLRQVDQEAAIYQLNQNVLNAGPTQAEIDLIAGWYQTSQILNPDYVPARWAALPQAEIDWYQKVHARSCRTCHVALSPTLNFDDPSTVLGPQIGSLQDAVCDVSGNPTYRYHSMPNSLVTSNRFWLSENNTAGVPDQVAIYNAWPSGAIGTACSQ